MSSSAREALLAEAIGDLAKLLNSVGALVPALDASCAALIEASAKLEAHAAAADGRIAALTQASATHAVKHIARRTEEMTRSAMEVQVRAMEADARELFRRELTPALQRLSQIAVNTNRRARWWTYAGTAALASMITCAATVFLLAG